MADADKKSPVGLVIFLIVLGLLLAGGISYYIATSVVTDTSTEQVAKSPGCLIKLGDPKEGLILNVGGVNSGRFLKIGLVLEVKPDKDAANKEGKISTTDDVKILDTVVHVLRTLKLEDFEPNKQENLKILLKNEINKTLGYEKVYAVYITNFVLQ